LRERGQPGTVQYAQQAGRHVANVPPGSARRDDAQLTDDVVFEVPLAAPILHVRAPEKVVAGTSFHLEVILDEIPKEVPPECALSIGFRIHPAAQSPVSTADNAPQCSRTDTRINRLENWMSMFPVASGRDL